MIASTRSFTKDEVAVKRMNILNFYKEFGEKATIKAFGADRKVISKWNKRLLSSGGKLVSLIPDSTRPINTRVPKTRVEVVEFIKNQREAHFRIGKEKLKVFLDQYCEENSIKKVSVSTIGNIIKRNNFFYQQERKVYHDPSSKWA